MPKPCSHEVTNEHLFKRGEKWYSKETCALCGRKTRAVERATIPMIVSNSPKRKQELTEVWNKEYGDGQGDQA